MEIAKIIQAICSGKSRKEVYNLLSPEEKDTLNRFADNGLLNENFKGIFGNANDEQGNAGVRSSGIRV